MKEQSTHDVVMERTRRALVLKAEGKTLREIAQEFGTSTGTVSYYVYTIAKGLKGSEKKSKSSSRRVVSVLGSTVNGTNHHDWFVAGWVAAYAVSKGLDPKSLAEDALRIIEGKESQ